MEKKIKSFIARLNLPPKIERLLLAIVDIFLKELNLRATGKILTLGVIVGLISGTTAIIFNFALDFLINHIDAIWGYVQPKAGGEAAGSEIVFPLRPYLVPVLTTLGGLLSGVIVYKYAPEAEGHGTDAVIEAYHFKDTYIRKIVPLIKGVSSVITIGSGGSAGKEGPIAQVAAGISNIFAGWIELTPRFKRIVYLSAVGSAIGAIFKTPLGGAVFAAEVLYRGIDMELEVLLMCITSSVVAYSLFGTIYGWVSLFEIPDLFFSRPIELPVCAVFSVFIALIGIGYIKTFILIRDFFKKLNIPNIYKPAIGGFLVGILALFFPHILGPGYGWIQEAINTNLTITVMMAFVVLKILATSFTIGSGGSGGVFAPSVVTGSILGGLFGRFVSQYFPGLIANEASFVILGMGGMLSCVANTPLAAFLMVTEMTGSYKLIVPMLLVAVVSYIASGGLSLYESQVSGRFKSPIHRRRFFFDIMEDLKVKDVITYHHEVIAIPEDMYYGQILKIVSDSTNPYFPVVNEKGEMVGIFSMEDMRKCMGDDEFLCDLLIAKDLGTTHNIITTTLDENLNAVMKKFLIKNLEEIPVVDASDGNKVIGFLGRRDIFITYQNKLQEMGFHFDEEEL
jgi:CIC family chloride channel protein